MITIYHNPRCSKSRQTLQLLNDAGVEPEVILYLEQPPTADELATILSKLGISARALLRKGEEAYKEHGLQDEGLSDQQLIAAMISSPKLIERPIVVKGDKAIIGRPPENINSLL